MSLYHTGKVEIGDIPLVGFDRKLQLRLYIVAYRNGFRAGGNRRSGRRLAGGALRGKYGLCSRPFAETLGEFRYDGRFSSDAKAAPVRYCRRGDRTPYAPRDRESARRGRRDREDGTVPGSRSRMPTTLRRPVPLRA